MTAIPRPLGAAFIESKMTDTCSISRDVRGVDDAVLNEATGELVSSIADTVVFAGDCLISLLNSGDKELKSGDMEFDYNVNKMLLPKSATTASIRPGDRALIVASANLPSSAGREYRVVQVEVTTHSVYTRLLIEYKEEALGTPRL